MSGSLLERQNTFGATALSQLVRGNKIPNIAANSSVPTAVPISISQIANAVTSSGMSASASPTSLAGSRNTAGVASTSAASTATGSGGSGTYTSFTWHVTTTGGNTVTAIAGTSATTGFQATVNNLNDLATATAYCTVVDSSSNTANTNTVNISLTYTGP